MLATLVAACTTSVSERPYQSYLEKAPANTFAPPSSEPRLEAFEAVFSRFDPQVIRERLAEVYAEQLYFNDTFHTFTRRDQIQAYFLKLADTAETRVRLLDVSVSGDDALLRWSMNTRFKVWWKDLDIHTVGMTHIRFNAEGQIVMHQDYWDGVEGFYAHLPFIGSPLKAIRSRLGEVDK